MKLTLSWIREFVAVPDIGPEELVDVFESLGHEVEEWSVLEAAFSGVVVGQVLDVRPHPNADKVRLTTVDIGTDKLEIICGAWNFEVGAVVPVAVPGAVLGEDFEISRREIRGVTSNGMICSEIELALGEESDGIMVLNDDYPNAKDAIGHSFAPIVGLPDLWFEINITPNRPDCLSVYGLARDLAAYFELPLAETQIAVSEGGEPTSVDVVIEVPEQNPRFTGRQVRGITVGPSPHWLRMRLDHAGMRPISNVVDASNYAMVEFGYPTHAFDVDRLGGHITVRMASEGEQITTLDEKTRTLTEDDIVVTDGKTPVAIGGVMGGASTEVSSETTDVFVEAAYWDPASVLMTSKRLGLRSEASARFERGADPSFAHLGADRVAQLLEQIAGGVAASSNVDVDPGQIRPWTVEYPLSETLRILGVNLDSQTTSGLLTRLEFDVAGDDPLSVTVPTRRPDVQRPVDLIEEIARLHGFDGIPNSVPHGPGEGLSFSERRLRSVRDLMVGAGFHETMTFSFIGSDDLDRLGLDQGTAGRSGIRVVNPLNDSEGVMRTTLLPGVIKSAAANLARRSSLVRLFEIGKVFLEGTGKLPEQPDRLAFVIAGTPATTSLGTPQVPDIFDGTGVWELLTDTLEIPDATIRQATLPSFHPGRCAEILIGDVVIGSVGEVHPSVTKAFGVDGRVVAAELDLAELLINRGPWQYVPPSVYPPVIFDMAFIVDEDLASVTLVNAVQDAAGPYLENVRVFDVFRGDAVGADRKSIAVALRLRADDRTLTDDDAVPIRQAIAAGVASDVGGELRGTV